MSTTIWVKLVISKCISGTRKKLTEGIGAGTSRKIERNIIMEKYTLSPEIKELLEGDLATIAIEVPGKEQAEVLERLFNKYRITEFWQEDYKTFVCYSSDSVNSGEGFAEYYRMTLDGVSADYTFTYNEAIVPNEPEPEKKYLWEHASYTGGDEDNDNKHLFLIFDDKGILQLQPVDPEGRTYQEAFESNRKALLNATTVENWGYDISKFNFYEIKEPERRYVWHSKRQTEDGLIPRLFKGGSGVVSSTVVLSKKMAVKDYEKLTVDEVKGWGFDISAFDKEVVDEDF